MGQRRMGKIRSILSALTRSFLHYTDSIPSRSHTLKELKRNGLKVGKDVVIDPRAGIDRNFCFLISIGDHSVIAANAVLLAHDASISFYNGGYGRMGRIDIKENCIISMGSIVMPGVTIGPNVLVAAGSVVNKDIPPNSCVAGVPARFYMKFDEMIERQKEMIKQGKVYEAKDVLFSGPIDPELKRRLIEDANKGPVLLHYLYDPAYFS